MLTTSISDFRKNIKKYLDSVTDNFETLMKTNILFKTGRLLSILDNSEQF